MGKGSVPRPPPPKKAKLSTTIFYWSVEPNECCITSTFYVDGSCFESDIHELARCGWGFVCLDANNVVVAAAFGTCPPWIEDIGGAEAWGLLQATLIAAPGSTYRTDCQPLLTMVRKGQSIGDDPKKPYARVHSILMAQLDDTPPDNIDWMPAHSTKEQVGTVMRGDGKLMTEVDRRANEQADILAKRGASLHRVPITEVDAWKRHFKMVKNIAVWIGQVTAAANRWRAIPFRDSEASRWKAGAAARARLARKGLKRLKNKRQKATVHKLARQLGGRNLQWTMVANSMRWKCTECLKWSAAWATIAPLKCQGKACEQWTKHSYDWHA